MYLDVGTNEEGESPAGSLEFVRDSERMANVLHSQGHHTRFQVVKGATHSEGAWRARFPAALQYGPYCGPRLE